MRKAGSKIKQMVLLGLGLISLMVGIVGIWVPGLPTTVFILISLWLIGQSSPKIHHWLYQIGWLKPVLAEADLFKEQRAVRRRSKIISQACAWSMAGVSLIFSNSLVLQISLIGAAVSCSVFMLWVSTAKDVADKALSEPSI